MRGAHRTTCKTDPGLIFNIVSTRFAVVPACHFLYLTINSASLIKEPTQLLRDRVHIVQYKITQIYCFNLCHFSMGTEYCAVCLSHKDYVFITCCGVFEIFRCCCNLFTFVVHYTHYIRTLNTLYLAYIIQYIHCKYYTIYTL